MRLTVTTEDIVLADATLAKTLTGEINDRHCPEFCPVAQAAIRIGLKSPRAYTCTLSWHSEQGHHIARYSKHLYHRVAGWEQGKGFIPGTFYLVESKPFHDGTQSL